MITIPQGSTGNRKYTAVWEDCGFFPQDVDKPEFADHALLLGGQIGVLYLVYIPDAMSPDECTMDFDVSGDARFNPPGQKYFDMADYGGMKLYLYECRTTSVQMADEIHAVLHCGEETISETYTVKEFLDTLIANENQTESADTIALAEAIKDYGSYVQPVLARNNNRVIGKKHAEMDSVHEYDNTDFEAVRVATSEHEADLTPPDDSGIKKVYISLVLNSETILKVYLEPKDGYTGDVSAYLDGGSANVAVKEGKYYIVRTGNIPAHELGTKHSFEVVTGDVSFTFELSPMSYVQKTTVRTQSTR